MSVIRLGSAKLLGLAIRFHGNIFRRKWLERVNFMLPGPFESAGETRALDTYSFASSTMRSSFVAFQLSCRQYSRPHSRVLTICTTCMLSLAPCATGARLSYLSRASTFHCNSKSESRGFFPSTDSHKLYRVFAIFAEAKVTQLFMTCLRVSNIDCIWS